MGCWEGFVEGVRGWGARGYVLGGEGVSWVVYRGGGGEEVGWVRGNFLQFFL